MSGGSALFSTEERDALLALKGVGPMVVQRLEQMGIASLHQLAASESSEIVGVFPNAPDVSIKRQVKI